MKYSDGTVIYEKSVPGRTGWTLPATRHSASERENWIPAKLRRANPAALPEVSEGEAMRHYVALSIKNFHIDKGFYPLGSCTMKYNPKVNDTVAGLSGFANIHPLTPERFAQGALQILFELQEALKAITGFDAVTLQPAAGAQAEFAGVKCIKAYHEAKGRPRHKILIPDSAHGTNPATVAIAGCEPMQIKSSERGILSPATVREAISSDTAGLMITNPNTLGLFETEIAEIVRIAHDAGALVYMDGANLNAQLGIVQPGKIGFDLLHINLHKTFSTPHGGGGPGAAALCVRQDLERFLPAPVVTLNSESADGRYQFDWNRPQSAGRVHSFYGNFGNIVRAWAYIRTLGPIGLRRVSENAIINANYLRALLSEAYDLPFAGPCQHEVVFSASRQKKLGVRASDISKRLLDHGFHAPTTYFPLIVPEALMIEPTETESRETLDAFVLAMLSIAKEAETDPETLKGAPYTTPVRRLDETRAARNQDFAFTA